MWCNFNWFLFAGATNTQTEATEFVPISRMRICLDCTVKQTFLLHCFLASGRLVLFTSADLLPLHRRHLVFLLLVLRKPSLPSQSSRIEIANEVQHHHHRASERRFPKSLPLYHSGYCFCTLRNGTITDIYRLV